MKDKEKYIKAYHDFNKAIDFNGRGLLPDLDNLVWYLLLGVPHVPADEEDSSEASSIAVDQRVSILKAVFVEVNKDEAEDFLDQGLFIYDKAAKKAKDLLKEEHLAQSPHVS